jgi:tetratricopeptide (TPR) repeat protein
MNAMLLAALLLPGLAEPPKKPVSARPAVLVLKVKGEVMAGKRRVEPGDLLLPGETLTTGADAEALLVFLLRNERRRLKPGRTTTLTRDDCRPADAIEKIAGAPRLPRKNLTKVREVEVHEGGGVGVLRGEKSTTESRIEPLFGTFVMSRRPAFTWPAVEKAISYTLELSDNAGQKLWQATTKETKLAFPEKEKSLQYSQGYRWTVKAALPDDELKTVVDGSKFTLLFDGEPRELEPVRKLAESDAEEDLILAAAAYEGYRVHDEALKVFEKLARLNPKSIRYLLALASYYDHAGRPDRAKEAREKAKQLSQRP